MDSIYRAAVEINLDNISYNMKQIRKAVKPESKVLAIVKADGYGHGAVETAGACIGAGADWLGVAICEEGIHLRKKYDLPILILGYTADGRIADVIKNRLTQAVYSVEMAEKFSTTAVKLGMTAEIHIKMDTGMGRIGFQCNKDAIEDIVKISRMPNIKITGIFTHFATSDEYDKAFTYQQYDKFVKITRELEERGISGLIRHAANSGAILDMPELSLDMVRAGIIIYGLYPSDEVKKTIDLKPAMSIHSRISHIKYLDADMSVSYGRDYFTNKKTLVATIPIGYADGYSRKMAKEGRIIVNGKYAPVIGRICMDQFMADITGIENVSQGDEVVIMGSDGACDISCEELAQIQGTINYEVVCDVGKRLPRIYIKDNEPIKVISYV